MQQDQSPSIEQKKEVDLNQSRLLINQWLVYAFWGFSGLALVWLVGNTFNYYLSSEFTSDNSVRVARDSLLPLIMVSVFGIAAMVQDIFYSKHENQQKTGTAAKLMVAHTVLFAIASIISLVVALFAGGLILTDPSISADEQMPLILTAVTATIYFTALTIRTAATKKPNRKQLISFSVLVAISVLSIIAHLFGPIIVSILTYKDQALDSGVSVVSYSIEDYVQQNKKLPESIDDLHINNYASPAVLNVIKDGSIKYIPNTKPSEDGKSFYQLCATYKHPNSTLGYTDNADRYESRPDTKYRGSGEVCYKLYATGMKFLNDIDYDQKFLPSLELDSVPR